MDNSSISIDGLTQEELDSLKKMVEFAAGIYDNMLAMTGEKKTALWAASEVLSQGLGISVSLAERPRWEVKDE